MTHVALKLSAFAQIWRCFENPLLITLMRVGLVRVPTFAYRIQAPSGLRYTMLARPGTTSLADLFVLREVFVEETYADILPLLPKRAETVVDVGANLFAKLMEPRCFRTQRWDGGSYGSLHWRAAKLKA